MFFICLYINHKDIKSHYSLCASFDAHTQYIHTHTHFSLICNKVTQSREYISFCKHILYGCSAQREWTIIMKQRNENLITNVNE